MADIPLSVDTVIPEIEGINQVGTVTYSGKIYDSHTVYDKHIPYYGGMSTDAGPSIESIEEL